MMKPEISLAIVDDNSFLIAAIRDKLSFFEELSIKSTAENGAIIIEQLEKGLQVDLILMDIEMPLVNGIEATEQIKKKYPHIKIIILTVFDNDENIFNTIKAGADGYLLKDVQPQHLYEGILQTLAGGAAMNPSIAMKTLKLLRNPFDKEAMQEAEDVKLSTREVEVLEQLSKGLSYTIIAENLHISPSTVRKHIENIYQKLQVHSKLEAIQKAQRSRLI